MVMKYSKAPVACKAFMAFMLEAENYNKWLEDAVAYLTHPLNAYDANPVWRRSRTQSAQRGAATGTGSVSDRAAAGRASAAPGRPR